MPKVTSIRLSDETVAKLDELAGAMERPRTYVIEQAIARYIEEEGWQILAIKEAVDDVRAGTAKLIPHEEVMREMDELLRARLPEDADRLA